MKKIILSLFIFFPLMGEHFVWEKTYGSNQRDFCHGIQQTIYKILKLITGAKGLIPFPGF